MDHSTAPNAQADPQQIERAEQGWQAFTFAAKAGVAAVGALLILMVLFLL